MNIQDSNSNVTQDNLLIVTDCRRATSGSSYFTKASYECIMIRKK
ncbi:hypothetical protein ACN4EE_06520 [Geminocystis sp. CENA526]